MQDREAPRQRRPWIDARRLALWGTALAVASWIVHVHDSWGPGLGDRFGRFRAADYVQFYVSGSLTLHGRADQLYDISAHVEELHRRIGTQATVTPPLPNYGPQVAAVFVPLAALPFPVSLAVFTLLSVCSYAAAVFLLLRSNPPLQRYRHVVGILAVAYPAFAVTLRYGQLSTFTLLLTSLTAWSLYRDRAFAAGLWFGLLAFKPPLLPVVVLAAIIARQWRFVLGVCAVAAGQMILALAVGGGETMGRYIQVLRTLAATPDLVILFPETSHSVRGFLRLLGVPAAPSSVASAITLVLAAAAGGVAWRRTTQRVWMFGWLILATVLASPHLLTYDLLLLAVPAATLSAWALTHRDHQAWGPLTMLLVLVYFAPFSVPLSATPFHVQVSTLCALTLAVASAPLLFESNSVRSSRESLSPAGKR
jgi:alpha-1,2-mannosyltransferase